MKRNEVMRFLISTQPFATEVFLLGELGENKVFYV